MTQLAFFIYNYCEHLLVLDTFVVSLTDTSWKICVKGVAAIMEPPIDARGSVPILSSPDHVFGFPSQSGTNSCPSSTVVKVLFSLNRKIYLLIDQG